MAEADPSFRGDYRGYPPDMHLVSYVIDDGVRTDDGIPVFRQYK